MFTEQIKSNIQQLKGKIKQKWGQLTDDDIELIKGDVSILAGKIRERYNITEEKAKQEAEKFMKSEGGDSFDKLSRAADAVKENVSEASEVLVKFIKEKPIASAAMAFLAGLILAAIGRK